MKKLLFATLIISSFGTANCMEDQLKSPVSDGDIMHDVNYSNLPTPIATHLEQAHNAAPEQDIFRENKEATIRKICFSYFNVLKMVPDLQLLPLLPDAAEAIVACIKMMTQ